MEDQEMNRIVKLLEMVLHIVFIIALGISIMAITGKKVKGEADIGQFSTNPFNIGWQCIEGGEAYEVRLPSSIKTKAGEKIVLENILPKTLSDGMRICTRSSIEDIYIYIDGVLRGGYASKNFKRMGECLPSAYLLVDVSAEDSGKPIRIEITAKVNGNARLNDISIGYGNNSWFMPIQRNATVVILSLLLVILGMGACMGYFFFRRKLMLSKTIIYLGLLVMAEGLWALSESEIRQLFCRSPSYASIFTFLFIEMLGAFACLYFDEVQEHKYRKYYVVVEVGIVGQLFINTILHFTGVMEYYQSLSFSHIWMAMGIVVAIVTLIKDICYKKVKHYAITAIGMLIFVVASLAEIARFYVVNDCVIGMFLSIGLIILLAATLIQTINDEINKANNNRIHLEKMNIRTLKTVARAIDAKDEYTGGHSERVAKYAEKLALRIASQYGFNVDDLSRIHYIGLLHDIGKIGVPDSILNKPGRLTDEEYEKMKTHTVIGEEMLSSIDNVPGLLEGIRYHHERYDGRGYPDGLMADEIPLIARILCIADCYDAMTSDRIYRKHLQKEEVIAEFKKCSGTQFDPKLVEEFLKMLEEVQKRK